MIVLDCRSLDCPQPIVACKKCIEASHPEMLQVLVGNQAAVENVSRYLEKNDYKTFVVQQEESLWCVSATKLHTEDTRGVLKRDADVAKGLVSTGLCDPDMAERNFVLQLEHIESECKTIVLLTSDLIGSGDDVLGAKLMENFLVSLREAHLWKIILLNGGVRLATQDNKNLESLKQLEANGVEILVCGACLTHFGLYENKKVGVTTNMLDVVTALDVAGKVIRP